MRAFSDSRGGWLEGAPNCGLRIKNALKGVIFFVVDH